MMTSSNPSRKVQGTQLRSTVSTVCLLISSKLFLKVKIRILCIQQPREKVTGYSVLKDINGNPAIVVRTDADSDIYAEGQKSLRYIVFFLLFAGLMIGAGCKFLLDREVVSRIVAIDSLCRKGRKG